MHKSINKSGSFLLRKSTLLSGCWIGAHKLPAEALERLSLQPIWQTLKWNSRRISFVALRSSGELGATRFTGQSSEKKICAAVPTIHVDQISDLPTIEQAAFSSALRLSVGPDLNQFQLIFCATTELGHIFNGMSG